MNSRVRLICMSPWRLVCSKTALLQEATNATYNLRNADVVLQHCQCCKLQLKHVTRCNVSAQPH